MLLHGDELGRTQQGNNNTYAQDSELSWIHWDAMDQPLVEFTAVVNKIRHDHPIFRRSRFFDGRPVRRGEGEKLPDIVWLNTDGKEMLPEDWGSGFGRTIGVFYNGHGIQEQDSRGRRITDDSFLLAFNAHDDNVDFHLPAEEYSPFWDVLVDTADQADTEQPVKAGSVLQLAAKSLVVLRAYSGPEVEVDFSAAASLAAMAEHEDEQHEGAAPAAVTPPEKPAPVAAAAEAAPEAPAPEAEEAPEAPAPEAPAPEEHAEGSADDAGKGAPKSPAEGAAKEAPSKKTEAKKPRAKKGPAK
jgi:glycogen operon protein